MDWRSIKAETVDWTKNPISAQAGNYLKAACRDVRHDFCTASLGEIADMGVRVWLRQPYIGPMAVKVLMWAIDEAAEGKCPVVGSSFPVNAPYVPRAERGKA
jgi:hypothetical protein